MKSPYREAVGAVMWTASMKRPDIGCAVRAVARFWVPWTGALLNDGDVGHNHLLRTKKWATTFREQDCGLSTKASTTRNV